MKSYLNKMCLVRGNHSGLFFGVVESIEGQNVTMLGARNIHYWDGACGSIQIAVDGVAKPGNCKFTRKIDKISITDMVQISEITDKALKTLESVKTWEVQ